MESYNKELALHIYPDKQLGFEGWYFRITNEELSLAFIIGVSRADEKENYFIQMLDTVSHTSNTYNFTKEECVFGDNPFLMQVGNSIFSEDGMHVDLDGIKVDIIFEEFTQIERTKYAPTIMGPFSYLKSMECVHAVISIKHHAFGKVQIQDHIFDFDGTGYIEKDYGTSFPTRYIWLQSNYCNEKNASFFFSLATIPMKAFKFMGCISILEVGGKQLRFASYLGARIVSVTKKKDAIYIVLRQFPYRLYIVCKSGPICHLLSPSKGKMVGHVGESLEGKITVYVYKYHKRIMKLHFYQSGMEEVNFFTKQEDEEIS